MKPYYERGGITIYHGDALEILPTLPSVDLVVTDPPYAFGLASTAQEGKAGSWSDLMNNAYWYAAWLRELHRLTANRSGAAWVFNSWRSFPILARAGMAAQWGIESLLIWDKEWIGPGGNRGLRPSYEQVALFCHSDFQLADRGLPDIWRSKWSSLKPSGHPAEKPVALIRRLVKESGVPTGGVVLDPFMGSGTSIRAAADLGISAIGIEMEERWCDYAAQRMSQEAMAFT